MSTSCYKHHMHACTYLSRTIIQEEFEDTKGAIRIVYQRRTDNTMTERKGQKDDKKSLKIPKGGNQNPYIEEEQTTQ